MVEARFDDLLTGNAVVLRDPVMVARAHSVDEVTAALASAEEQARLGRWVAVAVAYEAGAAFDPAVPQRPVGPGEGVPLVWFAAFDRASHEPSVAPSTAAGVHDLRRRGGGQWFADEVEGVRDAIAAGDVYQVNLTDRVDAQLAGEPTDLYARMAHAQRGPFNALLHLGDVTIVSASPELFFDADGGNVTTRPMKGTMPRSARPEADGDAARRLTESEKDRAENVMIVDLLRNDLGRVAEVGTVRVPDLCTLERYETVWQLTSTVAARVLPATSLVDLFAALFPCGSITGAPKVAAMRHIHRVEPWPRGAYCGAIGLLRPSDGSVVPFRATFSVAIRTAVVFDDGRLVYGAGGGITIDSNGRDENAEVDAKTKVLVTDRPEFELLETLRVEHGRALHLARHLDRVEASARHFGFRFDRSRAQDLLVETAAKGDHRWHRLRLLVARDGACTTTFDELGASPPSVALALATLPVRSDDVFTCHKTTHRAVYDLAAAAAPHADDVLLWNERCEVTETCRANVLYRLGECWYTPPLSSGGLPGVGRQVLLDDGSVTERVLPVDELPSIDELHVVSALRGRRPAELVSP